MRNLISFPHRAAGLREEAATWIVRLDRGLSEAERAELQKWLSNPAHREALIELAALANEMGSLAALAEWFPLPVQTARSRRLQFYYHVVGAAAACCALVLMIWLAMPQTRRVAQQQRPSVEIFETSLGENSTLTLQDGSTVTLNTASRLDVRYSEGRRNVYLRRGEAYFSVAHDARRPFNVYVGTRRLEAVGTAFNVRVRELGAVEVTVTEGQVKVWAGARSPEIPADDAKPANSAPPPEAILAANEAAIVHNDNTAKRMKVDETELDARLAWQRGMLIFDGEPLESVLTEIARYSDIEFVVQEDALRGLPVGGDFNAADVGGLLLTLEQKFGIEAERLADGRIMLMSRRRRLSRS